MSEEIRAWYEDYVREQENLRAKARNQGRVEGAVRALLIALCVRGIAVPHAALERILAVKDRDRLERLLEKAILATSLEEVLDEPS